MIVQNTYKVFWKYNRKSHNKSRCTKRDRDEVTCIIENKEKNLVAKSIVYCSEKDQFNKDTGRKLSLTKAIRHFPKSKRKLFWREYFRLTNKKTILESIK